CRWSSLRFNLSAQGGPRLRPTNHWLYSLLVICALSLPSVAQNTVTASTSSGAPQIVKRYLIKSRATAFPLTTIFTPPSDGTFRLTAASVVTQTIPPDTTGNGGTVV